MNFTVLTLFPEQVRGFLETSITGRAMNKGVFSLDTVNIRNFAGNAYNKVDYTMFGGGTGMLIMCEPVYEAWKSVMAPDASDRPHTVYLTPKGVVLSQAKAIELSKYEHLVFLCGHYEGIDQRVLD